MKKIFISAMLVLSGVFAFTSCCCSGSKCETTNDTIVPKQLSDSVSMILGAFEGSLLNPYVDNDFDADELARAQAEQAQFIEGFQLIVGNDFSQSKLDGMRAALNVMYDIDGTESSADISIDRNLYLQAFRRYIQDKNLTAEDKNNLYLTIQTLSARIEKVIERRNQMRGETPEAGDDEFAEDELIQYDPDEMFSVDVEEVADTAAVVTDVVVDENVSDLATNNAL